MKTIGVYTYVLWGERYRIPYKEMILSVAGLADEIVVIVDERFNDGTIDTLHCMAKFVRQLRIIPITVDLDVANIDGKLKAIGRRYCNTDYLVQMDADEVMRPEDISKILAVVGDDLYGHDIISTSVVNWFNGENIKYSSAGGVKERISRNIDTITHGIPRDKIRFDNYFIYASLDTDGAGYISDKGESLQGVPLLCGNLKSKKDWNKKVFIHHYSWYDLSRKWGMKSTWHYFWGRLYGKYRNLDDYQMDLDGNPVDFWEMQIQNDEALIKPMLYEMKDKSIWRKPKHVDHPAVMQDWIAKSKVYYRRTIRTGFQKECRNI